MVDNFFSELATNQCFTWSVDDQKSELQFGVVQCVSRNQLGFTLGVGATLLALSHDFEPESSKNVTVGTFLLAFRKIIYAYP